MSGMKSAKKAVKKAAVARKKAAAKKAGGVAHKAVAREHSGIPVVVQNLGPVVHAVLRLKPLTIFAGPNGTGKTFVCKALHSAIGAMIANPGGELFDKYSKRIQFFANALKQEMPTADAHSSNFFAELEDKLNDIKRRASSVPFEDEFIEQSIADLRGECKGLLAFYSKNQKTLVTTAINAPAQTDKSSSSGIDIPPEGDSPGNHISEEDLREGSIRYDAKELRKAISVLSEAEWGNKVMAVGNAFYNGIAANFQILPHDVLGELKSAPARVDIANATFTLTPEAGPVEFSQGEDIRQKWLRTLFLDSPVYWKLKSALENMRMSSARQRELDDVPQYFYDIAVLLRKKLPDSDFPEMRNKLEKLEEEVIRGKIVVTDTNTLRFDENGRGSYSMHATAGGIVNLGVLSLLIERGIVAKNTIVFVDEPESNLHTEWQVEMAETLYELARGGVNIVIATHSIDILKRLEIYAKKDADAEKLIAVNHFVPNGKGVVVNDDGGALLDKIIEVKKELSKPFFELFAQGL